MTENDLTEQEVAEVRQIVARNNGRPVNRHRFLHGDEDRLMVRYAAWADVTIERLAVALFDTVEANGKLRDALDGKRAVELDSMDVCDTAVRAVPGGHLAKRKSYGNEDMG